MAGHLIRRPDQLARAILPEPVCARHGIIETEAADVEAHESRGVGIGGGVGFALVEQIAKEVARMSNPIYRITRHIVTNAIDSKASAVQIELGGDGMAVYYHSEGAWHRQRIRNPRNRDARFTGTVLPGS